MPRRALEPERAGADVALDERRVGGEVGLGEGLHLGRLDLRAEALLVDLAVAGHADRERLAGAVGVHERHDDVLERVAGGPRAVLAREALVEVGDERSIVGVSGVSSACAAGTPSHADRVGRGHAHGLDVGGIPAARAVHVGVLADLGRGEELLALAAAHGAGHRLDDDVVEAEPVEDADVGLAVQLVALVEPGGVDVEGVASPS